VELRILEDSGVTVQGSPNMARCIAEVVRGDFDGRGE
jgi:hypothetical protein